MVVAEVGHDRGVVGPLLEGLLVDGLLGVDPLLHRHVLHAGVVALHHLVAEALGDLGPHPFLGAHLTREVQAAAQKVK